MMDQMMARREILRNIKMNWILKTVFHERNRGKGAAIRTGSKICHRRYRDNSRCRLRI